MTSALGKGLDSVFNELDAGEETDEVWEPFNWTHDLYQLMCREYRQSLSLVNMENYESKYQTESERKWWGDLYQKQGRVYDGKAHIAGEEILLLVISDPPEEFIKEWCENNGYTVRTDPE